VSSQTIVSSPSSGCLSDQTHPFAAPCQPFLYAQATSGNGFIQITPQAGTVGDAISGPNGNGGVPLSDANLFLVRDSSTMQIEQISKVQGAAQTSSAELNLDTSGTSSGGTIANAQADNDPATVSNQYSSVQPFQSATPLLSEFGNGNNGNGLTLVTSDNDSGTVVGTTAAANSPSPACADLTGTFLATVLPCGSASMQQAGSTTSTMAANLVLFAGPGAGSSLDTTQLAASAAPASPTRMFTSRLTTPSLGYCPTTPGDGCVHAGGQRSIGTATLAGLPSGLLGARPGGWGTGTDNYLVQLSGYSDSVAAESGVGTSGSLPSASQTGTPTLRYWNGTGYTSRTVNWGANPPTLRIPPVSLATSFNGQAVTVRITNTLVAGGYARSTSGSAPL